MTATGQENTSSKAPKGVRPEPADRSAGTTPASKYRPSDAERERSERQGDLIDMYRREY